MSLLPGVLSGDTTAGPLLASHPHSSSDFATPAWPNDNGCSSIPVPRPARSAFPRTCVNTLISTIP